MVFFSTKGNVQIVGPVSYPAGIGTIYHLVLSSGAGFFNGKKVLIQMFVCTFYLHPVIIVKIPSVFEHVRIRLSIKWLSMGLFWSIRKNVKGAENAC
jgi:hypothetical protein